MIARERPAAVYTGGRLHGRHRRIVAAGGRRTAVAAVGALGSGTAVATGAPVAVAVAAAVAAAEQAVQPAAERVRAGLGLRGLGLPRRLDHLVGAQPRHRRRPELLGEGLVGAAELGRDLARAEDLGEDLGAVLGGELPVSGSISAVVS